MMDNGNGRKMSASPFGGAPGSPSGASQLDEGAKHRLAKNKAFREAMEMVKTSELSECLRVARLSEDEE